jgi:succinate dehydrogenase/fumarate reductase flavoprotein subunit
MSNAVGLVRNAQGLQSAADQLAVLERRFATLPVVPATPQTVRAWAETRALLTVAPLVVQGAQHRQESRGAHARLDHPHSRDALRHRLIQRLGAPIQAAALSPLPSDAHSITGESHSLQTRSLS